ncbi:MAG: heat-inducible transcription repressor HrcA [Fimbriimonadales bacterium]|nr:MAG: heat-inducible transcription repressor HrcA [Fimbriimonadales bacterium]
MSRRSAPETGLLGARKAAILRAVAREHIRTGEPVGSHVVAQRYALGIKPATVRNEMAAMTEYGYLLQPHTSAGRVPTTQGYRYYVQHLVERVSELRIESYLKRMPEPGESHTEILEATLQILARAAHYIAFAATSRDETIRLLRCVITPCGARRVLSVVILEHGIVDNRLVDLAHAPSQRALNRIQSVLSSTLEGQTARQVLQLDPEQSPRLESPAERETLCLLMRTVQQQVQEATEGELLFEGMVYLIQQPEFQRELNQLEAILRVLDERKALYRLLHEQAEAGVQFAIGEENPIEALRCCTLIFTRYYVATRPAGMIGLMGPVRMDYDHALPTVQRAAHALSDILTRTLYS